MASALPGRRALDAIFSMALIGILCPSFASGSPRVAEPAWDQNLQGEKTAALLYAPPSFLPAAQPSELRVEVLEQGRVVIRQTVELPSVLPEGATVEVLVDHPRQREDLQKRELAQPGSIRLSIWHGGRPLEELALGELEEIRLARASREQTTVGTTKRIDFLVGSLLRRVSAMSHEQGRDPVCVQGCQEQRDSCYLDRCEPQVGGCGFCETYYESCVNSCPKCPTTRDYSTTTVTGQTFFSPTACFYGFALAEGRRHEFSYRTLRSRFWRETTNCDGSKTTVLLNTVNWAEYCWQQFNVSCSPAGHNNTQYPTCIPR